jgi:hypothetical protein
MQDASLELNQIMQGYFKQTLLKANKAGSCKPSVLENALHCVTGGLFWARIENDIQASEIIDRRTIARERSIYQDICFTEGCALYMAKLGFLMKIGDFYIGSDKLGHFLDQGYDYFQSPNLSNALEYGEMTERTYYGLTSTAIYSYADLAANLDGYEFWKQVTGGKDPYFSCTNNVWTQQRTFDVREHVNAAWDEGLNCSHYRNEHVNTAVHARIAALGLTCPIDKSYCAGMIERYGYLAPHVITKECF